MGACSSSSANAVVIEVNNTEQNTQNLTSRSRTARHPSRRDGSTRNASSPSPTPSRIGSTSTQLGSAEQSIVPVSAPSTNADNSGVDVRASGGLRRFSRASRRAAEEQRRRREIDEIEQLQRELAAMESFFQTLLGQAYQEMGTTFETNGTPPGGPPPASDRAIRQLPTVVVKPEDLVDETNRECCVCYCENQLGDRVTRLPCGHLFHRECVSEWLTKHCTCPVCRYELPTDDEVYERGRVERMKRRKPRYRRYELDRMPVRDLCDLAFHRLGLSHTEGLMEKKELVEKIVKSGRVDIVESPPPAEYRLSDLRAMGVGKLKSAMTDAGVFFNAKDVVEKEDVVQLFLNSGRVSLLHEEEKSGDDMGVIEEEGNVSERQDTSAQEVEGGESTLRPLDEELGRDARRIPHNEPWAVGVTGHHARRSARGESMSVQAQEEAAAVGDGDPQQHTAGAPEVTNEGVELSMRSEYRNSSELAATSSKSQFAACSTAELKCLARDFGVDVSDCLEKSEMVDRIDSASQMDKEVWRTRER